jgi:hypothetical protein
VQVISAHILGSVVIPDIVEARAITEGALPRAWRDTTQSIALWFWFLTVVLLSLGAVFTPAGWQRVVVAFGLGIAPFVLSLLWQLIVTPYRQRDEARRRAERLEERLEQRPGRRDASRRMLAAIIQCGDLVVGQLRRETDGRRDDAQPR